MCIIGKKNIKTIIIHNKRKQYDINFSIELNRASKFSSKVTWNGQNNRRFITCPFNPQRYTVIKRAICNLLAISLTSPKRKGRFIEIKGKLIKLKGRNSRLTWGWWYPPETERMCLIARTIYWNRSLVVYLFEWEVGDPTMEPTPIRTHNNCLC